ncbi:hypothetical protein F5884DRAFT_489552 [Xylogone sp. PMI_703]|nr:hypothetical protein F5884DRAFT_489552 [Xylogone sp. PMI_703]
MAGTKRKRDYDDSSSGSGMRPAAEAKIDPTYGQRSAFPGLDEDTVGGDDDELQYDEEGVQALMYLRAVRKEASGIPTLLVAPKVASDELDHSIYNNGVGDSRGWYSDGAYTAAPDNPVEDWDEYEEEEGEEPQVDPQAVYFDSILTRFATLRQQLSLQPPMDILKKLDSNHPTHVPRLNAELSRTWRWWFRNIDPLPAQLAAMDKSTVLRLLGLLTTGRILRRGEDVDTRVSRWAWGLLAKLPERGELVSEEIGIVRELGKRAVLLGAWLKDEKAWEEGIEEVEREFEREYDGEGSDERDDEGGVEYGGEVEQIIKEDEMEPEENPEDSTSAQDARAITSTHVQGTIHASPEDPIAENETTSAPERAHRAIPATREAATSQPLTSTDDILAAKKALLERLQADYSESAPTSGPGDDVEMEPRAHTPEVSAPTPTHPDYNAADRRNTRATINMILTVAGELYGQRDLLEFREVWEMDSAETVS